MFFSSTSKGKKMKIEKMRNIAANQIITSEEMLKLAILDKELYPHSEEVIKLACEVKQIENEQFQTFIDSFRKQATT